MKKNKMMRLASVLTVLTLLSTSVISGTFAKYITSDTAGDSATVAKWGVKVEIENNANDATDLDLFKQSYNTDEDGQNAYTGAVSVSGDTNRVAPGTTGSVNFKITGQPEVAVRVSVEFDVTNTIMLEADSYTLDAGSWLGVDTTVEIDKAYEPIYFYLYKVGDAKGDPMTLSELKNELEGDTFNKDYDPNAELDAEYTLEWHWDFEGEFYDENGVNVADFLDTVLGNNVQTEEFELTITVTQID